MSKKSKKATIEVTTADEIVIEPKSILTDEEVKELKDDEIIDVVVKNIEEPIQEVETVEEPQEKTVCRVVLATPTYFVINKNGVTITINELNQYRRGEEIVR